MSEYKIDPVELTRELVRINTCNPPGNEASVAAHLADLLKSAGFQVSLAELEPGRPNLIARLAGKGKPLCFTGHMDTVPEGQAGWSFNPHGAETDGDRLLGRGSSDMKSGLAAVVAAAVELAGQNDRQCGLVLVFTSAEETGCQGSKYLAGQSGLLGEAGAIVVAEPTANRPGLGHKGAFWYEVGFKGKAAHGSMPEQGDNAIYKAARAITGLAQYQFQTPAHPMLGRASLNVGTINGGTKVNIVPDRAVFELDVRVLPGMTPEQVAGELQGVIGPEAELSPIQSDVALWTGPDDPWVESVFEIIASIEGAPQEPCGLTYFTDAVNLYGAMGDPPTLIIGPGQPEQAHQTDEWCSMEKIVRAVEIYKMIGQNYQAR